MIYIAAARCPTEGFDLRNRKLATLTVTYLKGCGLYKTTNRDFFAFFLIRQIFRLKRMIYIKLLFLVKNLNIS